MWIYCCRNPDPGRNLYTTYFSCGPQSGCLFGRKMDHFFFQKTFGPQSGYLLFCQECVGQTLTQKSLVRIQKFMIDIFTLYFVSCELCSGLYFSNSLPPLMQLFVVWREWVAACRYTAAYSFPRCILITSVARSASEKRDSEGKNDKHMDICLFSKFWSLMRVRGFELGVGDVSSVDYSWGMPSLCVHCCTRNQLTLLALPSNWWLYWVIQILQKSKKKFGTKEFYFWLVSYTHLTLPTIYSV